jgi:hypothetical protein
MKIVGIVCKRARPARQALADGGETAILYLVPGAAVTGFRFDLFVVPRDVANDEDPRVADWLKHIYACRMAAEGQIVTI